MKYWVYMNGEVPGSYLPEELAAIPGFAETSLVCPAEGGIENRNWRGAGEFGDLAEAISAQKRAGGKTAPVPDHSPLSPDDILNDASSRIFLHVSDLMGELQNRREERALTQALQRQVAQEKNELLAARERIRHLEDQAALIPGFEERERKHQDLLARGQQESQELEARRLGAEQALKRMQEELEGERRKAEALQAELQRQKTVGEGLSGQLAAKELTLARAFGIIRRLEETLRELVPGATAGISREVPRPAPEPPMQAGKPRTADEISAALAESQQNAPTAEAPAPCEPPAPPVEVECPALTTDSAQADMPADGEVHPVPPPWHAVKDKVLTWLKGRFSFK
ncbi:MAG: hypothetical protein HY922_16815 [Elusimicrobia bacterium]|nr:hypothetical protein [Elusimicrobiota bacterium]